MQDNSSNILRGVAQTRIQRVHKSLIQRGFHTGAAMAT
jgi:hypothetical protein